MAELLTNDYIGQLISLSVLTDDEKVFVAEIRRTREIVRQLIDLIRLVDHRTGVSERRTQEHTDRLEALIESAEYPERPTWRRRRKRGD